MNKIIKEILNLFDDYRITVGQGLPWGVFLQKLSGKYEQPLSPELKKLEDRGHIEYDTLTQVYTLNMSTENIRKELSFIDEK